MKIDQLVAAIALSPLFIAAFPAGCTTQERAMVRTIVDVLDDTCKGVESPRECLGKVALNPKIEALEAANPSKSEITINVACRGGHATPAASKLVWMTFKKLHWLLALSPI